MKNFFAHRFTKRRAKSIKTNRNSNNSDEDHDDLEAFTPEIECKIIKKSNIIAPEEDEISLKSSLISGDSDYIMNMILEAEKKNRELIEGKT